MGHGFTQINTENKIGHRLAQTYADSCEALIGFYLTICCQKIEVSVVSVRVSVIKNFKKQKTNTKWFDKLTTSTP